MTNLLLAAAQADTVVTVASRDVVDVLIAVAAGFIALGSLALFVALAIAYGRLRKVERGLEHASRRLRESPAIESLRRTADNVAAVSDSVRAEAERLSESVNRLSEQLTHASRRIDERIEEFNALMEVVQGEAEGAFVDGAATARGVRAGLGALARGGDRSHEVVMKPAAGPESRSGKHLPDPARDETRSGIPDSEAIEKASPEEGPVSAREQP